MCRAEQAIRQSKVKGGHRTEKGRIYSVLFSMLQALLSAVPARTRASAATAPFAQTQGPGIDSRHSLLNKYLLAKWSFGDNPPAYHIVRISGTGSKRTLPPGSPQNAAHAILPSLTARFNFHPVPFSAACFLIAVVRMSTMPHTL